MEEQNLNTQIPNTEAARSVQEFVIPSGAEYAPDVAPAPASQETAPMVGEGANQNAGMTLPPVVPQPIAPQPTTQSATAPAASVQADPNPVIADDVDVIEKEWVDKARKIVDKSKDDPYLQELEVGKLQADYMKKRYGKEIKSSNAL
ncbi:hypothetical protein KA529_01040 [Candidatus Saccharibacteria bacterium]|nr:hypothetical protein [Candidatus Saccharibacteria bacterium]